MNVNEDQYVDMYGNEHPLTVRYTRTDYLSHSIESSLEFYDGDKLVEKYIAKGKLRSAPWYSMTKAQLRDDKREEIVGLLLGGTGFFINDLFVLGADDQGRILSFPVEIKTKKTGDIVPFFDQHEKELRIPFSSNPFNAALILRWNAATGKFVLCDNFDQIPRDPDINAPLMLTESEGESLGGYTLIDRHWYTEQGRAPFYNTSTGEFICRHGGAEVHAVRGGRNLYNINMIIIDGPDIATVRGIRVGDPAEKVINAYGNPLVNEYDDLILYEYGCESKPDRILRFAVKKSTLTVDYVSLRVTNIWKRIFPPWE